MEKKGQITSQYWKNIACTVEKKVFDMVKKEFHMCTCASSTIIFAWDQSEVGIIIKKLDKSEQNFPSQDPKQLRQMKINEFAVKVLCEMSIESGIEKKTYLEADRAG